MIIANYERKVDKYTDIFKEDANESLTPSNPIDSDNLFGTGGSCRKLSVD